MNNPAVPAPAVQNPLTLVAKLKSPEDSQHLQQALLANAAAMKEGLDAVGTVHFARWFFLDNDMTVILVTEYDGPFDVYVKDFIAKVGNLFNALLQHVTDPPALPVQQFPDAFVAWVNQHNIVPLLPLYSSYPSLTVLNIQANAPA